MISKITNFADHRLKYVQTTVSKPFCSYSLYAVKCLTIVASSPTQLSVSWSVPSESWTDTAVEYRLINRDQCMESDGSQVENGVVTGTSSTLTNLFPYSTYEVSMRVGMGVETEMAMTLGSSKYTLYSLYTSIFLLIYVY